MSQPSSASQAVGCLATNELGDGRYIYAINSAQFMRYDTWADTWQFLCAPPVTPTTVASMRYTANRGHHMRVLSATASTITVPGLNGNILNGAQLRIDHGTGAGQVRTITLASETIHDAGAVTGSTTTTITDASKKWRPGQWIGYQVLFTKNGAAGVMRNIIDNDATSLTVAGAQGGSVYTSFDIWNGNQAQVALVASPYSGYGTGSGYQIRSQTFSLNSNWDTTPDSTSFANTLTGGLYLLTSNASNPFATLMYYDVAADYWLFKNIASSVYNSAISTDMTIDRAPKGTPVATKVGTVSAAARSLTDSGLTLSNDRYRNYRIEITSGTGRGQHRRVVGNTSTTFYIERPWTTTPDSTSGYGIYTDYDRLWIAGNNSASMHAYVPSEDWISTGDLFDTGVLSASGPLMKFGDFPAQSLGTAAQRISNAVTAINPVPTAGGSNYSVNDILTCSVGGSGCQVVVDSVSTTGAVTGITLWHSGTSAGYTTGAGKATTGGTGTGCTIEITSVGTVGYITTNARLGLKAGDQITLFGHADSLLNGTFTLLTTGGPNFICTGTGGTTSSTTPTTTLIFDPTKNWVTNEHAGRLIHLATAANAASVRWIVSNTANTLTLQGALGAAQANENRYAIYDAKTYGSDDLYTATGKGSYGWATSGTTTSLTDSSKSWLPNQWAGYLFKVEAGTGYGSGRIAITSNTATTLNFATQSFTPDATTRYDIADSWGLSSGGTTTTIAESTTKNWPSGRWTTHRVRITSGTGVGQEWAITSNTATILTAGSAGTAPDTTSAYSLIGISNRGSGIELLWAWGSTDAARTGRYMILPRSSGGQQSNVFDFYDITTGRWVYGQLISASGLALSAGASYAYDGADTVYVAMPVAGYMRYYALNVNTLKQDGAFNANQPSGTVHIGNWMEVVKSDDGVKYLYNWLNTSTLFTRAMIF